MKLWGKLALATGCFILGGLATHAAKSELKEAVPEIWDWAKDQAAGIADKFSNGAQEAEEFWEDVTDKT